MRKCKKCQDKKALTEFDKIYRATGTYYSHTCKSCRNAKRRKGTKKILFYDGVSKECGACGEIKLTNEFANRNGKPTSKCKSCHNAYYKQYYSDENVRLEHRKRVRKNKRNLPRYKMHGLSEDQFNQLKTNNGLCPICNIAEQKVIDHDHNCCPGDTGCEKCVRGYICSRCNVVLGLVLDSPETLISLASYLRKRLDFSNDV